MSEYNPQEQIVLSTNETKSIIPNLSEVSYGSIKTENTSKRSRNLRKALIGFSSIGLVAGNLVPELKFSNSAITSNFDNVANASVTVNGKPVVVMSNDLKNGFVFTDQDYTKHQPNNDFLDKYKNISDEGINQVIKSLVSEQKVQQISNIMVPSVKPEDQPKVIELTQEIVTQLNNPNKTFNIDSKTFGNRPKETQPSTTNSVIDTSPKGSFIKPAVSPLPEAPERVTSKPEQIATPGTTKPTKIDKPKDDLLERAAIGGLVGLTLTVGIGIAGIVGYKKIMNREAKEQEYEGFDFETNTRYPKIGKIEALKHKLFKTKTPEGPTREDFENMDDEDFEDRFINVENNEDYIGFGSKADKKYKLYYIFTNTDLVLSPEVKSYLYQLIQNTDINMFSSPEKLTSHLRKELNWTSYEISIEDLLTISDILLDKNL